MWTRRSHLLLLVQVGLVAGTQMIVVVAVAVGRLAVGVVGWREVGIVAAKAVARLLLRVRLRRRRCVDGAVVLSRPLGGRVCDGSQLPGTPLRLARGRIFPFSTCLFIRFRFLFVIELHGGLALGLTDFRGVFLGLGDGGRHLVEVFL